MQGETAPISEKVGGRITRCLSGFELLYVFSYIKRNRSLTLTVKYLTSFDVK